MEVRTVHGGLRAGLVALLLLGAALSWAQDRTDEPAGGRGTSASGRAAQDLQLRLRGWEEISRADRPRAYTNPAWLLLLAPGVSFFGYALLGRLFPRRLPFFLLLPLLLGATPGGPEQLVREAEGLFRGGDYHSALERYREAAELLPGNPVLLYDLALSSHLAGERGHAVAYLRRAVREEPRDLTLRSALARLEAAYELQGQLPLPLPVHADVPFFLAICFANLTLVMASFVVRRGRVQFLIVLVLAAVFTAASLGVLGGRLLGQSRPVGVLEEQSPLLRIPEPDSRTWLELPAGTTLRIRGLVKGFSLVETGSQLRGWVAEDRILLD